MLIYLLTFKVVKLNKNIKVSYLGTTETLSYRKERKKCLLG